MKQTIFGIIQFGLIKVTPGLFNIALVPFLIATLGTTAYGQYSLWLGFAMLVANVISGVVAQPMYRRLSSHPEERDNFNIFTLVAAAVAGAACLVVLHYVGAPVALSLGFSVFSIGTVLSATITVGFIIERRMRALAAFEGLRILAIISVLAIPSLTNRELSVNIVVSALAISNFLPILLFLGRPKLIIARREWFKQTLRFGTISAVWVLLAGVPIVGAKTILINDMSGDAFGSYAALSDLTYRALGMSNAVLWMWAFPLMSRQFDCGEYSAARRTLFQTLGLYSLGGVLVGIAVMVAIWFDLLPIDGLPSASRAALIVTAASFFWHAMSSAHKVLEMKLQTIRMVALMAIGVILFYFLGSGDMIFQELDRFMAVNLALILVAALYVLICLTMKFESDR